MQRHRKPLRRLAVLGMALIMAATISPQAASADPLPKADGRLDLSWELTDTGVTGQFRGLSAVSSKVAWVAGSGGTILRTVDGGGSWQNVSPAEAAGLEFRDIEAFDARRAVALTIGPAEESRVYVTDDGGTTWTNTFTNAEPTAFYDCMAFFDTRHGIAMSDPVDGRIRFIRTADGGRTWSVLPAERSPEALPGEFAFAASGQCLVAADRHNAYLVTGGAETARIIHTADRGATWTAHDTAVKSGPSAGIYAAAFADAKHGILVGGDYTTPTSAPDAFAYTGKGPAGLELSGDSPGEYRSGVSFLAGPLAVTVGPTGSDLTFDGGRSWHRFDDGAFDSVDCVHGFACWASGPKGRVAKLSLG
ncbi:WD40/YVTN/BNR-like repeat-containing protein [Phytomonospora endophytica]|uniref:Photosystem II stability/assembly factor-like uncharacterized protein n=1 Tax=Phytomonospora endophytica TaxID=714109 RepID=A0A841FFF8_9ACTN|nr:oxidoreductase [Phytomonospora endophytica]MBB6032568.1 photosystem II stability/assembly factor-like uncharacterized protein [Phytomonospora endophytica]GIG66282.1 oxidoreductase [Phytomonospora endophytica]